MHGAASYVLFIYLNAAVVTPSAFLICLCAQEESRAGTPRQSLVATAFSFADWGCEQRVDTT